MAEIIENKKGRRMIRLSADDIISAVREYQRTCINCSSYSQIRERLKFLEFFLPEE